MIRNGWVQMDKWIEMGRATGLEEAAALADSSAVTFDNFGLPGEAKACRAVAERIRNWAAISPAPPACLFPDNNRTPDPQNQK